jgi:hypothetical protein
MAEVGTEDQELARVDIDERHRRVGRICEEFGEAPDLKMSTECSQLGAEGSAQCMQAIFEWFMSNL